MLHQIYSWLLTSYYNELLFKKTGNPFKFLITKLVLLESITPASIFHQWGTVKTIFIITGANMIKPNFGNGPWMNLRANIKSLITSAAGKAKPRKSITKQSFLDRWIGIFSLFWAFSFCWKKYSFCLFVWKKKFPKKNVFQWTWHFLPDFHLCFRELLRETLLWKSGHYRLSFLVILDFPYSECFFQIS